MIKNFFASFIQFYFQNILNLKDSSFVKESLDVYPATIRPSSFAQSEQTYVLLSIRDKALEDSVKCNLFIFQRGQISSCGLFFISWLILYSTSY